MLERNALDEFGRVGLAASKIRAEMVANLERMTGAVLRLHLEIEEIRRKLESGNLETAPLTPKN